MGSSEESARAALKAISGWRWISGDPDGNTWPIYMELSEAINRLAMAGFVQPHSIVLNLICRSDLIGHGSFKWRKYQFGNFFQHEEHRADLHIRHWQTLSNLIDDYNRELADNGWPFNQVDLDKLELQDCFVHEWCFSQSRFAIAVCPPDTPVQDKSYFEEWFSAWDIQIRPRIVNGDDHFEDTATPVADVSRGGRPMADWWPDFVAELVAYVDEVGLPPGVGHQGQSDVIREVSERMQARGKGEPSRSQVQETVNAVLRRMRLAGN